tara:strand:- start:589 stop:1170 length:582 start_codon:yes stop_codon:yes gene_type:complete
MKSDPINKVKAWMEQARNTEKSDADAISLATIDEMGFPNVRMVLLRKIEADSFVFFTNYTSKKAKEIEFSNKVAFSFHWKSLAKQIRVRGVSEKEDGVIADDYYSSRDLGSRIGAWASRQSAVLKNRQELLQRVREVEKKFKNDPPRPSFWGGIRIRPISIEFWTDGEFRLHERELWTRTKVDSAWSKCLLYP